MYTLLSGKHLTLIFKYNDDQNLLCLVFLTNRVIDRISFMSYKQLVIIVYIIGIVIHVLDVNSLC